MSEPRLLVRPRPGVKVRRPEPPYHHLPDEPMEVPETPYWVRRVSDGDLLLVVAAPAVIIPDPPPAAAPPKSAKEHAR